MLLKRTNLQFLKCRGLVVTMCNTCMVTKAHSNLVYSYSRGQEITEVTMPPILSLMAGLHESFCVHGSVSDA